MFKAIVEGKILTMTGAIHAPGSILFQGKTIVAVGKDVEIPPGTQIFSAKDCVVMPGLIDAHTHLGISEEIYATEGDDLNEFSDPITPHLRALDAINPADLGFADARQGGITTVGVAPGSGNVLGGETLAMKTWGRTVAQMLLRAPAGMKAALGENPKRCYGEKQKAPMTRMAIAGLLREALVAAQNYQAKIQGLKTKPDAVFARDLKMEALLPVLERKIPLKVHAHRADDIATALRIGEEFDLDLTIEHGTEAHKLLPELLARKVPVIVGPSLTTRAKVELKDKSFRTPGILAQAGLKVALMTDHPVIPVEYLSVCAALAVKAGMSEAEALKAITINPAEILGLDAQVGSLAPGKDADVIVLSGSILDVRTQIKQVFINGEAVLGEGLTG